MMTCISKSTSTTMIVPNSSVASPGSANCNPKTGCRRRRKGAACLVGLFGVVWLFGLRGAHGWLSSESESGSNSIATVYETAVVLSEYLIRVASDVRTECLVSADKLISLAAEKRLYRATQIETAGNSAKRECDAAYDSSVTSQAQANSLDILKSFLKTAQEEDELLVKQAQEEILGRGSMQIQMPSPVTSSLLELGSDESNATTDTTTTTTRITLGMLHQVEEKNKNTTVAIEKMEEIVSVLDRMSAQVVDEMQPVPVGAAGLFNSDTTGASMMELGEKTTRPESKRSERDAVNQHRDVGEHVHDDHHDMFQEQKTSSTAFSTRISSNSSAIHRNQHQHGHQGESTMSSQVKTVIGSIESSLAYFGVASDEEVSHDRESSSPALRPAASGGATSFIETGGKRPQDEDEPQFLEREVKYTGIEQEGSDDDKSSSKTTSKSTTSSNVQQSNVEDDGMYLDETGSMMSLLEYRAVARDEKTRRIVDALSLEDEEEHEDAEEDLLHQEAPLAREAPSSSILLEKPQAQAAQERAEQGSGDQSNRPASPDDANEEDNHNADESRVESSFGEDVGAEKTITTAASTSTTAPRRNGHPANSDSQLLRRQEANSDPAEGT
ncbi:unnamed protein product [Amoebophrya sp. A25]|nr:unnamed protein product [Amoebophrya sp. A25]|eukprot:GSA25T00013907001.1